MRKAFFNELERMMAEDTRVTLVTGDMGFGVVEPIRDNHPKQYVNAGIAEQHMTGLAAGLALSGRVVFTYSIGNFPTLRCLEQIRNDICYHNANVKVVSVGAGLSYGALGTTHHAAEDIAILRSLPNMTVIAPGDPVEAEHAARAAARTDGPFYLRIGRAGEPRLHAPDVSFRVGKAIRMGDGEEVVLMATGSMLETALKARDALIAQGVAAGVLSMHTVKPLDESAILRAATRASVVATLEEHSVLGGLGGAVSEVIAEAGLERPPAFKRIGLPSAFAKTIGSQEFLRRHFEIHPEGVLAQLAPLVEKRLAKTVTPTRATP